MKNIVAILIFSFCLAFTHAQEKQEYTHSLQGISWVKVSSSTTVVVKTHDKNQLLIQGANQIKNPEKAKGLKAIYADGEDNTGIAFYVKKEGSNLIVRNLKNGNSGKKVVIYLPKTQNVSVKSRGLGHVKVSGFTGEVEADSGSVGHLTITDVTGPVTASSNTGEIEIVFDKVNQSSPISITTTTADVDVTLPGNTPADVKLVSNMGDIYTNFDIDLPDTSKNGMSRVAGGQKASGTINGGGVKITLRTTTGDIYLRKQ